MKRLLSLTLFLMSIFCLFSINSKQINASKIVFENFGVAKDCSLEEASEAISESTLIQVLIKTKNEKFEFESKDNYLNYSKYRKALKESASKHFYNKNKLVFEKLGIGKYLDMFICKYMPYIELTFETKYFDDNAFELLSKISNLFDIEIAYVNNISDKVKVEDYMISNFSYVGAYSIYEEREYTGSGIRVGLLESGIIDEDHQNIQNMNYVIRDELLFFETETEHAIKTASIIAGETGVAHDATIYSVQVFGNISGELDWLVENDVDIINMSFGENGSEGTYSTMSAQVDFVSDTYGIVCVAAVGNDGTDDSLVGNPALGYNVISVGSCNIDDTLCGYTSIYEDVAPSKPTICALGDINIPNITPYVSGTSFSCAFISGFIAMMMEQYPVLRGNPPLCQAFITANSMFLTAYNDTYNCGLDEEVGVGAFNYANILDNDYYMFSKFIDTNRIGSTIWTHNVYITAGDKLQISLCWSATTDGTVNGTERADFDIRLRGPNGLVYFMTSNQGCDSVLKFVRLLEAPVTGTYTIEIVQRENITHAVEDIYLAYSINAI